MSTVTCLFNVDWHRVEARVDFPPQPRSRATDRMRKRSIRRQKKKKIEAQSTASAHSTMASIWPVAAVVGECTKNQKELKQTTTTRTSPSKTSNEQNNSCARGVTKTKTLENEDLRPKTRSSFSYYENEDPVK